MKARLERKVGTGAINTRLHQLRQPAIQLDGSLSLNGVSIVASPHAGQRNPVTGDCHPGFLDRHNGVYITKTPRGGQSHSPYDSDNTASRTGARPMQFGCMESSLVRTPRGAGLGPLISPRIAGISKLGSPAKSPRSPGFGDEEHEGDNAKCRQQRLSPRKGGVPVSMLSKTGSLAAMKSFNDSLPKGHVDRGEFLERAFVPSHPNSQYAARIPAEYETFAGSMDRWAAGPGGGVDGMRGHIQGSWRDVHDPDTRPFPAPPKASLDLNLKLLPQSLTITDIAIQNLSCGAPRRRPLTARDSYPVSTGNTPRQHALRPQTARESFSRPSTLDCHQLPGAASIEQNLTARGLNNFALVIAQPSKGGVSKEMASLSGGSTTQTRRALEIMRTGRTLHQNQRVFGDRAGGVENLDVQGAKSIIAKRSRKFSPRSPRAEACAENHRESDWGKSIFHEEKGRAGIENEAFGHDTAKEHSSSSSPRSPQSPYTGDKQDFSSRKGLHRSVDIMQKRGRPHTAAAKALRDDADTMEKDAVEHQKAQAKHDFLNKVADDIELFSGRSKRPTTAPTRSQIVKNEMHSKMEVRNAIARYTFRLMDNDHDGVINAKDMAHGLECLNIPANRHEIRDLLSAYQETGRGGEIGMTFDQYAKDLKRIRFPSQNPFEGKVVNIPFWKPNDKYSRKWDGEYGKGLEGGGERIRTKLKWRNPIPPQHDRPVPKLQTPRGFVTEENWPMMSKFVPLDPSVPSERPRLAPGGREKLMSNWARRFAKKAKVAASQHDKFLWKKRVFEEAKNSEYLLEKPLFAHPSPE